MTEGDPPLATPHLAPDPVPEFIRDLERALGIGIIVRAIEDGTMVTVHALVLLGQHSERIVGAGATEADAWRNLARSVISWRTTNDKHVPWWGGGGG
jgi:hypothetical protein